MKVRLALTLALPLVAGCHAAAGTPAVSTMHLRTALGAADDGGFAYAEVSLGPAQPRKAEVVTVGADGAVKSKAELDAKVAEQAVAAAAKAGTGLARTVDDALAAVKVEGMSREKLVMLAPSIAAPDRWQLELVPGASAVLQLRPALDVDNRPELQLLMRLPNSEDELIVHRFPRADRLWLAGLTLLPGSRKALVTTVSSTESSRGLYRTEGLSEVDLAGPLAALLDNHAIAALQQKDLAHATEDLERAVQIAPRDSTATYNLACAYALAGRADEALLTLGRAVDLDPERLKPLAMQDPDLTILRDRPEFRLMVEPRPSEANW